MLAGLPVRVGHGELVLVGEQRRGHGVGGRAHGRLLRHPRERAVAVGVGARARAPGRRRRRRHPSRASFRWLRCLGFARLETGSGGRGTGRRREEDNWRPQGGGGGEVGEGRDPNGISEVAREPGGIYMLEYCSQTCRPAPGETRKLQRYPWRLLVVNSIVKEGTA